MPRGWYPPHTHTRGLKQSQDPIRYIPACRSPHAYCSPTYCSPTYCSPTYCSPTYCSPTYCPPTYCLPCRIELREVLPEEEIRRRLLPADDFSQAGSPTQLEGAGVGDEGSSGVVTAGRSREVEETFDVVLLRKNGRLGLQLDEDNRVTDVRAGQAAAEEGTVKVSGNR